MESVSVVLCNVPDQATGRSLARLLLEKRLAACVNLLPGVQSMYRWQGAIEDAQEVAMLIKTVSSRYHEVEQEIRSVHPYELPEIICLPIHAGLPGFMDWVNVETRKDQDV
jgi:periplasmic divalent cation tolerance protein